MHSNWEDIGAVKANEYLAGSDTKRALTPNTIEMYKRDMLAGAWFPTHQGIAFKTENGKDILTDGGHRMRALIAADREQPGITIRFWVTRGVDAGAFEGFDIGRARTNSNMVQAWYPDMQHFKDVAAIAKRGIAYTAGHPWVKVQPSKHELHAFIEEHPSIRDAARLAHNWKMPRATLAPTAAGFCYWVLMRIDAEDGADFMAQVRSGVGLEDRDPVLILRNRLLGTSPTHPNFLAYTMKTRGREPEIAIALTVMAWNKWRSHEAITKLQLPHRTLTDDNFPVPRELITWRDPRGLLKG